MGIGQKEWRFHLYTVFIFLGGYVDGAPWGCVCLGEENTTRRHFLFSYDGWMNALSFVFIKTKKKNNTHYTEKIDLLFSFDGNLLEDLAFKFKSINIPSEHILNELLVFGFGVVKLAKFIQLKVIRLLHLSRNFRATEHPCTDNVVLGIFSINADRTKGMLAHTVKTLEPPANEVHCHESESQILRIQILAAVETIIVGINIFPQPRKGLWASVTVGITTLPSIHDHLWSWKKIQGIL
jgi:hypothetical protein